MKHFIALFIITVILGSLLGCGSTENELINTWESTEDNLRIEFRDNGVSYWCEHVDSNEEDKFEMNYKVKEDKIVFTTEKSGKDMEFEFEIKDEKLYLTSKNLKKEEEYVFVKVD